MLLRRLDWAPSVMRLRAGRRPNTFGEGDAVEDKIKDWSLFIATLLLRSACTLWEEGSVRDRNPGRGLGVGLGVGSSASVDEVVGRE